MRNRAYLSLGSNIKPEENLKAAVQMLASLTKLVAISTVWETKPLGLLNQPKFLNAAAIIETRLTPEQLKREVLDQIEQKLGRVRQHDKNGPRPIDIDLMLFNRQIFQLGNHHIPNREIFERSFVAIPLAEIAPDYHHPETGQTLAEIAQSFEVKRDDMRLRQDVSQSLAQLIPVAISRP